MVRVFIKGGVWKNSEDEILKAAVMKYGKQQWARVASLLNRKSAKQCKARWNEWLDPSVRKVEWSREEEEKLLHLAKLLPAQWRTIGPLIGRTATQCQEHYEKLLDEAAAAATASASGEASSPSTAAAAAEAAAAAPTSARKLRPGEIDTHPETRPARPDPIDMDEDEIEMLQEARARLANTQGKKAKRKAREKMLQEAKRLADLQKRRELKQAGLLSSAAATRARRKRKNKGDIDLGVEIPFHKPAPAGFHSTEMEDRKAEAVRKKHLRDVDYGKINESQYRTRDREAVAARKKEEARLRALERSNMQYVVAEVSKRNDPVAQRKRGVLSMPQPTVDDVELERVAKLSRAVKKEVEDAAASAAAALMPPPSGSMMMGSSATDALLGDYSDRPLPTPMRTPMTTAGGKGLTSTSSTQDVVMREASNLRMLQSGETPLLGGENPELKAGGAGTGVGLGDTRKLGGVDATAAAATPRLALTSSATPMGGSFHPSATPTTASGRSISQTPLSVAPRDELGLNRPSSQLHPGLGGYGGPADDAASVGVSSFATSTAAGTMSIKELAREERRAAKRARRELELALASLPAPQFEYELAAPDMIPDEDDLEGEQGKFILEKDAADLEAEEMQKLRKEAERLYEARSSVVKRAELPRPLGAIPKEAVMSYVDDADGAETLIREEMLTLLQHDAHAHPVVLDDPDHPAVIGGGKDKKQSKKNKKRKRKKGDDTGSLAAPHPVTPLDYFPEEELDRAKDMIEKEMASVLQEKKVAIISRDNASFRNEDDIQDKLMRENNTTSMKAASDQIYVDEDSRRGWITSEGTKNDQCASLRTEYHAVKDAATALRKRADKLESKLSVKNGGYAKRADAAREATLQSFAELRHSKIEEEVYSTLMSYESRGITSRLDVLQEEIGRLEKDEAVAQKRYGDLLHEKHRLHAKIRQRQKQTDAEG